MRIIFLFFIILAFSLVCFAQKTPHVVQNGKSTEASDLLGAIKTLRCGKNYKVADGTVINRNFENDETTIDGFIIRSAKDKQLAFSLDVERLKLLGNNSALTVNSLLANGRKVKVWYAECSNGSRKYNFAAKITAF